MYKSDSRINPGDDTKLYPSSYSVVPIIQLPGSKTANIILGLLVRFSLNYNDLKVNKFDSIISNEIPISLLMTAIFIVLMLIANRPYNQAILNTLIRIRRDIFLDKIYCSHCQTTSRYRDYRLNFTLSSSKRIRRYINHNFSAR